MNEEKKKMYSIRIHQEQLVYLKKMAKSNFTTVTQYILDLINNDMKNHQNVKNVLDNGKKFGING